MREILFRGIVKSGLSAGKWSYGSFAKDFWGRDKDECGILPIDNKGLYLEVSPETVGQYTGLKDKNGNRIFEKDILRNTITGETFSVVWDGVGANFVGHKRQEKNKHLFNDVDLFFTKTRYEVAGNIFENPELLG